MKENLPHDHGGSLLEHKLKETMPDDSNFTSAAELFRLLDDPNRLKIFWLLCHVEECVINISAMLGMSSPAVSHHLKLLKTSRLIVGRRDGKEVYYSAADTVTAQVLHVTIEKMLEISCPEKPNEKKLDPNIGEELSDEEKLIQGVHDYLAKNLDKRITIEELSQLFPMNPTTMKQRFKEIYGNTIAAHIKEHRMEKAAGLLIDTEMTLAQIAEEVGYTSQSKFSAAFTEAYKLPPLEYRKKKRAKNGEI